MSNIIVSNLGKYKIPIVRTIVSSHLDICGGKNQVFGHLWVIDVIPRLARAPFDASTPRRARGGSVPRGSLSPLCDASFVEAVATAPGVGADERREGREGTETPRWHLTQETVVPTGDVPQRCGRGDEATHARGIDSDVWWIKVDRTPIGAQGGCTSIPRGPYESVRDAADALRKIARADGRGIKVCRKRHSGKRSVMMCQAVSSLETTGERDIHHGVECAYTAVIERWDAKGAEAPGTYWITKYTPHTFGLCQAKPHYSASAVAADSHVTITHVPTSRRDAGERGALNGER